MSIIRKKRIFEWAAVGLACIAVLTFVPSCSRTQQQEGSESRPTSPDTNDAAMEAKIIYYETQLKNLSAQMDTIGQQIYLIRQDYLHQAEALEKHINDSAAVEDAVIQDEQAPPEQSEDVSAEPPAKDQVVQVSEYTYRMENGFAILTSYLGDDLDVIVPAAVDGHLVVGLDDRTFQNCNVRSVTLPETIEKIGWFTFYQCENLERIVLPSRLTSIGYASFDGCAPALCLYVKSGSYAERFANSFGLRYEDTQ